MTNERLIYAEQCSRKAERLMYELLTAIDANKMSEKPRRIALDSIADQINDIRCTIQDELGIERKSGIEVDIADECPRCRLGTRELCQCTFNSPLVNRK